MWKYSPCPRCGAMTDDTQYYCGRCGIKLEDEALTQDYLVAFESISAMNGHFGSSVKYDHDRRVVVVESWGNGRSSKTIEIPADIQTKRTLNNYLDQIHVYR